MNDRPRDPELQARFDALRSLDARESPAFGGMLARAQGEATADAARTPSHAGRARSWRRYAWTGALAAAAAIVAVIAMPRTGSDAAAFEEAVRAFHSDPALGAWQSPTDGLLVLPGDRLLSTIPSVGTTMQ